MVDSFELTSVVSTINLQIAFTLSYAISSVDIATKITIAGRGFAVLAFFTSLIKSSLGIHLHDRDLNAPLRDSYDYIVVGCGISGLVVANRLSEDDFVNVLCVEAGLA